ncbi:MAG: hypothetical protein OEL79_04750, partial [Chromatiales bacterium]|nr:hypothetical protein [Chromatiales bacterium]
MNYSNFLDKKRFNDIQSGFEIDIENIPAAKVSEKTLKDFQSALVRWALIKGKAAIFADTGLGKTAMQATWAHHVAEYTGGYVLIFAPLAVAIQTVNESASFGVDVKYIRSQLDMGDPGIYITNYEMREYFDLSEFAGVVLDESSILKSQTGKTRTELIEQCQYAPYRLSCTATPSPNDYMELGNQCEFLGIMSQVEMLAMFFINDTGDTGKWRLKGHAQEKFWQWMATWSAVIRKPSDLGFSDEGYNLPPLNIIEHTIESPANDGDLFAMPAQTLSERRKAKRETIDQRCQLAADLVNNSDDGWIVWCHLNDEHDLLESKIDGNKASVRGADRPQDKEDRLIGFSHGEYDSMISKPSICGFGMNWQHVHNMVFVGLDDSFEKFYQAVRREYRFGQKFPVNVHIVASEAE